MMPSPPSPLHLTFEIFFLSYTRRKPMNEARLGIRYPSGGKESGHDTESTLHFQEPLRHCVGGMEVLCIKVTLIEPWFVGDGV